MKNLLLIIALCLMNPSVWAAEAPVAVTNTVKVAGIEVAHDQILITPKPGYVHMIWDAFPNHAAIQNAGKAFNFEAAALDLAKGPGLAASPGAKVFKVDIMELSEKDSYGNPQWDKVSFLGRFLLTLEDKKWLIKKEEN